ncbi:MAG TPA: cation transporting ATPase C-terminal domain-containing protein [Polyangiaceae bacterium]|nr:cation transporting ATPase C-terminal domain-containing protein [Polyangiaceae bacterium]
MGKGGTDVARSAAAMILTDDNFATIAAAVEEGRGVYDNLVKFIAWTLPTNGGEGAVLLAAIAFGTELPALPVQLLWVNMMTAVLLGVTLVFEPREPGLTARPPRPVDEPILDAGLGLHTALVSLALGGAAFGAFGWAQARGLSDEQARTIAVNMIVVTEVGHLFACRSLRLTLLRVGLFSNPWVFVGATLTLAAQLAFTYLPAMNRLFHTAPIEPFWWAVMTAVGAFIFVAAEAKKLASRAPAARALAGRPGAVRA